jgi:peptidylprolyl isomerase
VISSRKRGSLAALLVSAILLAACQSQTATGGGCTVKPNQQWASPPDLTIDTTKHYTATISTTKGDIDVDLLAKDVPQTVNNFVFLAQQCFYNDVKFHRIIQGFMIQTGDPQGTGAGGPGYKFADEPVVGDYERGTLAMANAGKNTNGSQFFIVQGDAVQLPKAYTIFGKVTKGLDVVDQIASVPVGPSRGGERSSPQQDVLIKSVTIHQG